MLKINSRYRNTRKKTISITHEGHDQLKRYADAHGLSFSAAIEALALVGMKADLTQLLVPLLNDIVAKGLARNFNRLAKLSIQAAAESAMTHDLTSMLLLQLIRQEAEQHPEDFEDHFAVSHDPTVEPDFRIREVYNHVRHLARKRQKRLMSQPLQQLLAQYAQAETAGEKSESVATEVEEAGNG